MRREEIRRSNMKHKEMRRLDLHQFHLISAYHASGEVGEMETPHGL